MTSEHEVRVQTTGELCKYMFLCIYEDQNFDDTFCLIGALRSYSISLMSRPGWRRPSLQLGWIVTL